MVEAPSLGNWDLIATAANLWDCLDRFDRLPGHRYGGVSLLNDVK